MKILLDPILTALPSRCSTFVQFATWVDLHVKAKTPDLFFYWMVAEWGLKDQAEIDWLPKSDMLRLIPVPQHHDRTREYLSLHDAHDQLIGFSGSLWDWDVIVTVRSGLAALYKLLAVSPRQNHRTWVKQVWVIEEMPLMSFKSSVVTIDADVQDRFTIGGYQAADRVVVMSYHEGVEIIARARELVNPSAVMKLQDKIKAVVPVQNPMFELKKPKSLFKPGQGKKFNLAFVGRLSKTDNVAEVYNVITKQWIMRGADRVRMLVCTASSLHSRAAPPKYMDLVSAPREEFWRLCREEMDVVVVMHNEGGFSLSVAEPLGFGVPVIAKRMPWAVGMLGEDYPFFVDNETQAYARVKAFYDDYATEYAAFKKWHKDWFKPTYERRYRDDLLYDVLDGYLDSARGTVERFRTTAPSMANNDIVQRLAKAGKEFIVFDAIKALDEAGELRGLGRKASDEARDEWGLVWSTPWQDYRLALKAFYGYRDASIKVGHLIKD
jgi:hypothetical protein